MEKTEKRWYILGLGAISVLLLMIGLLNIVHWDFLSLIPPCGFRFVTGYYCPGCGGTRAVRALLQGRFAASFLYHPFVLYCVVIAGIFMISNTIQIVTKNKWKIGLKYRHGYLYGGIVFIIVNCVLQNIHIFINNLYNL